MGARLLEGLRDKLRAQSLPSLPATSRRETLPWNKHRRAEPHHASEWENKWNIIKGSFCSLWELGLGVQFYPSPARPDLQCCLLSKTQWWSLICLSFSTKFLAFEACQSRQSPMHLVSQTLLTNNPTWAAQKKDKVLISILQKQTLFSGKTTLQQRVLYSESCSVPAAPTALALWKHSSPWDGAVRDASDM